MLKLSVAKYQLRFIHPFGTAHGVRLGTDSVFVKLENDGAIGYGEATLPPYLPETQASVVAELQRMSSRSRAQLFENGPEVALKGYSMPCRAALSTAYYDLKTTQLKCPVSALLLTEAAAQRATGLPMMTLGHTEPASIPAKLEELQGAPVLKVKLGSDQDKEILNTVLFHDERPLFLDANQGWESVDRACAIMSLVGKERLVGVEQPFPIDRLDLHRELRQRRVCRVYGDESIQDMAELETVADAFDGVNIKLMKCGGLDRAMDMVVRARELGMDVMLGSMSESSLGCGAMAQLADFADLVDLDGPWLIANDPFEGLLLEGGALKIRGSLGLGIDLKADYLTWIKYGT